MKMGTPSCTWLLPMATSVRKKNSSSSLRSPLIPGLGRAFADLLHVLLPIVPSSLLSAQNSAGSTALHWAALNSQLDTARALVGFSDGPGVDLIDIKNTAGRTPLGEAEAAGWDEGAKWMVEVMRLDDTGVTTQGEEERDADADDRITHSSLPAAEMPVGRGDMDSS